MAISDELINIRKSLSEITTAVQNIEAQVPPTVPPPQQGDIRVSAGQNLQAALDAITPGFRVLLEPNAAFLGSYAFRKKAGHYRVTTENAADQRGARIKSGAGLAKIGGGTGPSIYTEPGAGDFELDNVEILPSKDPGRFSTAVALGTGMEKVVGDLAHGVTLRRVYSIVDWAAGERCRRFVRAECTDFALLDFSVIGYNHATPDDAQGFLTTNSPGPFLIENGYLEATGENLLFGGGDPQIKQLLPGEAGTTIRRVHCFKPLAWKTALRGYVKNLFELKNAKNVLVDQCVFENCWTDAQSGRGVLLTVRNQDNSAPWSTLQDITIQNSIIKGCTADALHFLGTDDVKPSVQASNLVLRNVQIEACARGALIVRGVNGLTFDHVTFADIKGYFLSLDQIAFPTSGLVWTNNLARSGSYGIHSPTAGLGKPALDAYAPGYQWGTNACERSSDPARPIPWPAGTTQLAAGAIAYDTTLGRYTPLITGSDGTPVGADLSKGFNDPR